MIFLVLQRSSKNILFEEQLLKIENYLINKK